MNEQLANYPVWAFRTDGSVMNLARPEPAEVDVAEIAARLSRIARFNGVPSGMPYSVAQHSVLGARAILAERRDQLLAALFLFHDAHEAYLGDMTRPAADLMNAIIPGFSSAWARVKSAWDEAIYAAIGLPQPSCWTEAQKSVVSSMDGRMCAYEARALLGEAAASQFPRVSPPQRIGAIRPWAAMKAEMDFMDLARQLIGDDACLASTLCAAANRGTC